MVYEFDQQKLIEIIRNSGIVAINADKETIIKGSDKIMEGLKVAKNENRATEIEGVETSDTAPCGDCGGIFFLRTGTCHVCQTCGASQGCS